MVGKRVIAALCRLGSALIVSFALVATIGVTPAQAAIITDGFDAGFIISDDKFYGGNSMTAQQVQTFLNDKVPKCTINDPKYPERKTGTRWPDSSGTQRVASDCLKSYTVTTKDLEATEFCQAYKGKSNESAAQIITKVGQSCGINQEVLLILLEKEMSLVTDTWPTDLMYRSATGYACYDTGPNNSANCDNHFYGFFNQVYNAAKQFQRYKKYPNNYSYKAGQNNKISWHHIADRKCGSANVYIENSATAALYIYTPYQPNKASLAAGWGTGDQCSSYGNRNFYNFYKSWFGQPNLKFTIHSSFKKYADQHVTWLGLPTAKAVSSSEGVYQEFSGGTLFQATGHGVNHLTQSSPILKAYKNAGFVKGEWGWPISAATNHGSGNNVKKFTGGVVVESAGNGAFLIAPQLQDHWESTGGFSGKLGAPVTKPKKGKNGAQQTFMHGTAAVLSGQKATTVDPAFLSEWNKLDGIDSSVGIPTGSVTTEQAHGGGKIYPMSNGTMYRANGEPTITLLNSALYRQYQNMGGPTSAWGWPMETETCDAKDTVCTIDFTEGIAVSTSLRGTQFTPYSAVSGSTPDKNAKKNLLGGEVN